MDRVVIDNSCVVLPYLAGMVIDYTNPMSIIGNVERALTQDNSDKQDIFSTLETLLKKFGLTDDVGDFAQSIKEFSGKKELQEALTITIQNFTNKPLPSETSDKIILLLRMLAESENYKCIIQCHDPKKTTFLKPNATHFGYVHEGTAFLTVKGKSQALSYQLHSNSYFCVPHDCQIEGNAQIQIISRLGIIGQFLVGGEIEDWGRLNYIDGCSDTLLIPPAKLGYPCFNALYFPENTKQTSHTHPSIRAGMVVQGEGFCRTKEGDIPLKKGDIFVLPPETWHAFHTNKSQFCKKSALTVVAFHPDSDYGPTDQNHPMLNRTYCKFLHRLSSFYRNGILLNKN